MRDWIIRDFMNSKMLESLGLKNYIFGANHGSSVGKGGDGCGSGIRAALNDMGLWPLEIYSAEQVHGINIEYCDGRRGLDNFCGRIFKETDGLITDKENIALLIKFADCTPVILFDPVKKVQAAIHSGWRGTARRISQVGIEKMVKEFGSKPEDIHAYLGPSIDMANYEVDFDVYDAFGDFKNRDKFFSRKGDKFTLSMTGSNLQILLESGIDPRRIEVSDVSTYEDRRLGSARRDKGDYKLNFIISIMDAE